MTKCNYGDYRLAYSCTHVSLNITSLSYSRHPAKKSLTQSVTSVSVRINQSESFLAVMFTCMCHRSQRREFEQVSSMFVMVSENICTICVENFHTEYGKCVATVPLFS